MTIYDILNCPIGCVGALNWYLTGKRSYARSCNAACAKSYVLMYDAPLICGCAAFL